MTASRHIAIVGAGLAAITCARTLVQAGHKVTVFEAAALPGGQIRLLAQQKRRAELIGIVDWRMAQCAALGVQFRFNTWAEPADILAEHPDVVIVATGGVEQNGPYLVTGKHNVVLRGTTEAIARKLGKPTAVSGGPSCSLGGNSACTCTTTFA